MSTQTLSTTRAQWTINGKYVAQVNIPIVGMSMNQLYRKHFSILTKEKKKWNFAIHDAFREIKPASPLTYAKITITRHSAGNMDFDNLVSTGKQLIDALKENRIIKDDSQEVIGRPRYVQVKSKMKNQYTTIMVQEIDRVEIHQCECKTCGNFI